MLGFLSCDMHAYVAYLLCVGSAWHDDTDNIMIHAIHNTCIKGNCAWPNMYVNQEI
jgi:hypothetical protein